MPAAKRVIDHAEVQALLAQGKSQQAIARALGVPQSTLSRFLKKGIPVGDQGIPLARPAIRHEHPDMPPEGDGGIPSDPPSAAPAPTPQEHPAVLPWLAPLEALLPTLHRLCAWWEDREGAVRSADAQKPTLQRHSYHIDARYIEAVQREADRTGESYSAVVNRAFAQYFAGRHP